MNEKHLNWCRSHDWGRFATLSHDGKISVIEVSFDKDNVRREKPVYFSSFKKLKEWAGY
jgi:hypothetical protein